MATREQQARYAAYSRLQALALSIGEELPIPELVVVGGQSDGKSSLIEALLGFRFNIKEVELGTRRPLIIQMVHNESAKEPQCRLQAESGQDFGPVIPSLTEVAAELKQRTEAHLDGCKVPGKPRPAVSAKPMVIRVEYAFCANLTIVDTPGLILKARKGEPDSTPEDIKDMVVAQAAPGNRIILFLQQSSVEWCSSLWLDTLRLVDPELRRTIMVASKFDNRLKEFAERWEVDRYLSASGFLAPPSPSQPEELEGGSMSSVSAPLGLFFIALPKDRGQGNSEAFRQQISSLSSEVLRYLREEVEGGFDEGRFLRSVGFSCLKDFLEREMHQRYHEGMPAVILAIERHIASASEELLAADQQLSTSADITLIRRGGMRLIHAIATSLVAILNGTADPDPIRWGLTTDEERHRSGVSFSQACGRKQPHGGRFMDHGGQTEASRMRLYGGAALARLVHEFRAAALSIACPPIDEEKVANIYLGRSALWNSRQQQQSGDSHQRQGWDLSQGEVTAALQVAQGAVRLALEPLLVALCRRMAFILSHMFDAAVQQSMEERTSSRGAGAQLPLECMGTLSVEIPPALLQSGPFISVTKQEHCSFVRKLVSHCETLVGHQLEAATEQCVKTVQDIKKAADCAASRHRKTACIDLGSPGYSKRAHKESLIKEEEDKENEEAPQLQQGVSTTRGRLQQGRTGMPPSPGLNQQHHRQQAGVGSRGVWQQHHRQQAPAGSPVPAALQRDVLCVPDTPSPELAQQSSPPSHGQKQMGGKSADGVQQQGEKTSRRRSKRINVEKSDLTQGDAADCSNANRHDDGCGDVSEDTLAKRGRRENDSRGAQDVGAVETTRCALQGQWRGVNRCSVIPRQHPSIHERIKDHGVTLFYQMRDDVAKDAPERLLASALRPYEENVGQQLMLSLFGGTDEIVMGNFISSTTVSRLQQKKQDAGLRLDSLKLCLQEFQVANHGL